MNIKTTSPPGAPEPVTFAAAELASYLERMLAGEEGALTISLEVRPDEKPGLPDYANDNYDTLVRFTRALFKGMDWGSNEANYDTVAQYCAERTKTSLESNQLQLGDAHWFNIADLKAGLADGTVKGYYEGMQNDMVQGGNIEADQAKEDVGDFVLFSVMEDALK